MSIVDPRAAEPLDWSLKGTPRAAQTLGQMRLSQAHEVVIRSGCYLTHDSDMYRELYAALKARSHTPVEIGFDLAPALEVWAHVQSIPEPGRMICGLGRRDVGNDANQPRLVSWARPGDQRPAAVPPGFTVSALNDQHAFVDGPVETLFQVGDLVGFGISHPCTTFDKWRALCGAHLFLIRRPRSCNAAMNSASV